MKCLFRRNDALPSTRGACGSARTRREPLFPSSCAVRGRRPGRVQRKLIAGRSGHARFPVISTGPVRDTVQCCGIQRCNLPETAIDSGIQEEHILLAPAVDEPSSHCFLPAPTTSSDIADYVPSGGHGTRVAGPCFSSMGRRTEYKMNAFRPQFDGTHQASPIARTVCHVKKRVLVSGIETESRVSSVSARHKICHGTVTGRAARSRTRRCVGRRLRHRIADTTVLVSSKVRSE